MFVIPIQQSLVTVRSWIEHRDPRTRLFAHVVCQRLVVQELRGQKRIAGVAIGWRFIEKDAIDQIVAVHSIDLPPDDFRIPRPVARVCISEHENALLASCADGTVYARIVGFVVPVVEVDDHHADRRRPRRRPGRPLRRPRVLIGWHAEPCLARSHRGREHANSDEPSAEPHAALHGCSPARSEHDIIRMLAFNYEYFRSHFYFRFRYLVKRKHPKSVVDRQWK
jgi:hypothetical protein